MLRCNVTQDAWSAEEDALLQRLYAEMGTAWSCISKHIANRTPQQCRGRWCILSGLGKNKVGRRRDAIEGLGFRAGIARNAAVALLETYR